MRFANLSLLPYIIIFFLLFLAVLYIRNFRFKKISFSNFFSAKRVRSTKIPVLMHVPDILKIAGIIFLCVALLRPQAEKKETKEKIMGIDIIIALDLSGSMQANDLQPNRLEAAKEVCRNFVKGLTNARVGMVVFAGKAFTQCPLTVDYEIVNTFLNDVDFQTVRIDGTAIGEAIVAAVNRLETSSGSKVVILATDGSSNRGIDPVEAAKIAAYKGVKVYTIGIGREGGAPVIYRDRYGRAVTRTDRYGQTMKWEEPDEKTLKSVAEITGAYYYRAVNKQALNRIYSNIAKLEKKEIKVKRYDRYEEKFFGFLIAGFVLLFLALLLEVFVFTRVIA